MGARLGRVLASQHDKVTGIASRWGGEDRAIDTAEFRTNVRKALGLGGAVDAGLDAELEALAKACTTARATPYIGQVLSCPACFENRANGPPFSLARASTLDGTDP